MVGKKGKVSLEKTKQFAVENTTGYIEPGKKKPLKNRMITIQGLGIPAVRFELQYIMKCSYTDKGLPQCNAATIKTLAGKINEEDISKSQFGAAYEVLFCTADLK